MIQIRRIATHIEGLDEHMEGGVPAGFVVLVAGRPGTMKSTLCYHMLHNNMPKGIKGAYITLEQSKDSLTMHLNALGYGLDPAQQLPIIVDLETLNNDPQATKLNWFELILGQMQKLKASGIDMVVIDSLSAIYALQHMDNPRHDLFRFLQQLRNLKLTTFAISEMPKKDMFGRYEVEDFLSDGVIHLFIENQSTHMEMFIQIVKMRATQHTRDPFPLIVQPGVFSIVDS